MGEKNVRRDDPTQRRPYGGSEPDTGANRCAPSFILSCRYAVHGRQLGCIGTHTDGSVVTCCLKVRLDVGGNTVIKEVYTMYAKGEVCTKQASREAARPRPSAFLRTRHTYMHGLYTYLFEFFQHSLVSPERGNNNVLVYVTLPCRVLHKALR